MFTIDYMEPAPPAPAPLSLGDMPREILLCIYDNLGERDRSALARTNKEVYEFLNPRLYRDNVRYFNASALPWSVENKVIATVKRLLDLGVPVNPPPLTQIEIDRHQQNCRAGRHLRPAPTLGLPLVCIAAKMGNDAVLRILLDQGADPNVFAPSAGPPLSLAVGSGHMSTFHLLMSHPKIDARSRVASTYLAPVAQAIRAGSIEGVQALLAKNVDIEIDGYIDVSLLHTAVRSCSVEMVQFLVKLNPGSIGRLVHFTAVATATRDIQMLQYILSIGGRVDRLDPTGITPLCMAIAYNKMDIFRLLINHGADVNNAHGPFPLLFATEFKRFEMVRLLLGKGANVSGQSVLGETALHGAVAGRSMPLIELLLKHGANPRLRDVHGRSPMYLATLICKKRAVQLLLDHGAEPDKPEGQLSVRPLSLAASRGRVKVMKVLLAHGAELGPDAHGKTPLDWAFEKSKENAALLLLQRGAVLNSTPGTLLTAAARLGFASITRHLLNCDFDPSVPDKSGKTPLAYAAFVGCSETVKALLTSDKININAGSRPGRTPLSYAAYRGHARIAVLLIQHGASVDAKNKRGRTALSLAAGHSSSISTAAVLIEAGADMNSVDRRGKSPTYYAMHSPAIYKYLLSKRVHWDGFGKQWMNQWLKVPLTVQVMALEAAVMEEDADEL
ncbi:ankyrin repeat-containing domain protein [Aspergillus heterothallicus]